MVSTRDPSELELTQRLHATKELLETLTIGECIESIPINAIPDLSLLKVLTLLNQHQLSRLPIVKDEQLVGIITRSDIIRIEVERMAQKWLLA